MLKLGVHTIVGKYLKNKLLGLGKTEITENDLEPILREVRIALLNSDVNLTVIKEFFKEIKDEILVKKNYQPSDRQDAIVLLTIKKKLIKILGEKTKPLAFSPSKLNKVLVVGLNGSGKTTTTAKLAKYTKDKHSINVKTVSLDIYRPGAFEQLSQLTSPVDIPCVGIKDKSEFKTIIKKEIQSSEEEKVNYIFFDNFGLLPDNETLLNEVEQLKKLINPQEVLFVMDAMSGQDILETVKSFHERLGITGIVVSKTDSNAPMGGVFSVAYLLKIPIKYMGKGENIKDLSDFHPDRIASLILGEGDIFTLAEEIEKKVDIDSSKKLFDRIMRGQFDMNDLIQQIREMRKIGSFKGMLNMMPGLSQVAANSNMDSFEGQLKIWEIIISSMTIKERKNPKLFKKQPNRKIRVIKGSGRKPDELNKLLKRWEESKKKIDELSASLKRGKNPFSLLFGR